MFEVDNKREEIARLEERMGGAGFWDSQEKAQKVVAEASRLKQSIGRLVEFQGRLDDLAVLCELVADAPEDEGAEYEAEIVATATALRGEVDELELQALLSGPHDRCNAILSINSGAGGTESCDWAEMLFRMYVRWGERRGFTVEIEDRQDAEEAGISSATLRIIGEHAYGYAKAERGVHRLVRISPFDANAKRHTSFCAVDVIAEIEDDDAEIEIKPDDIRVDTYRSSGKGGQHVNKTDSAVRITHLSTGIVVQCQNERSQLKNRATAMKVLRSRLFEKMEDEKRASMERFYGEKGEIAWGSQIRSYVFQPYQLVTDLRTGVKESNLQAVMDGDLDRFVFAWLRAGCPRHRSKDIKVEE